jgi:hypothetical protein
MTYKAPALTTQEILARLLDDGHFRIDGTETRDDLLEAYRSLLKGHDCHCNLHVYSADDRAKIRMKFRARTLVRSAATG